jgi:hypothetical protein
MQDGLTVGSSIAGYPVLEVLGRSGRSEAFRVALSSSGTARGTLYLLNDPLQQVDLFVRVMTRVGAAWPFAVTSQERLLFVQPRIHDGRPWLIIPDALPLAGGAPFGPAALATLQAQLRWLSNFDLDLPGAKGGFAHGDAHPERIVIFDPDRPQLIAPGWVAAWDLGCGRDLARARHDDEQQWQALSRQVPSGRGPTEAPSPAPAPARASRFCDNCGKENGAVYKFCLGCGAELAPERPPRGVPAPARSAGVGPAPAPAPARPGAAPAPSPRRPVGVAPTPYPARPPRGLPDVAAELPRGTPDAADEPRARAAESTLAGSIPGVAPPLRREELATRCPQCNEPVRSGNRFCAMCGYKLNLASVPAKAAAPAIAGTATPSIDQDVRFTVYRPEALPPGAWKTLLVFIHKSRAEFDNEPDPLEEVERRAERVLSEVMPQYDLIRHDAPIGFPRQSEVTLIPYEASGTIEFNPREQRFVWTESVHQSEFRLRAALTANDGSLHGGIRVFLGVLLIAEVPLRFSVTSKGGRASTHKHSVAPLKRVFASYSRADSSIVSLCERSAEALGIQYLRDVRALRAGEVWSAGLADLIRQSHVFQLFWSTNSMRSPMVRAEWEFALEIGKPMCPVYWQNPRPADPSAGLPPAALGRLHFVDLSGRSELARADVADLWSSPAQPSWSSPVQPSAVEETHRGAATRSAGPPLAVEAASPRGWGDTTDMSGERLAPEPRGASGLVVVALLVMLTVGAVYVVVYFFL